jgi:hypothetical protein
MAGEEFDSGALIREIVDYVMRILPPYETSLYLLLLSQSRLAGSSSVRIQKKTIGEGLGKGPSPYGRNYLLNLARHGFITPGDTTLEGTLYSVMLPSEVPAVQELMAAKGKGGAATPDTRRDRDLVATLFERDSGCCRYCGEQVTPDTAALDHIVPVSHGGADTPENLATACLMCKSIKAGRTFEAAAPAILAALAERRQQHQR